MAHSSTSKYCQTLTDKSEHKNSFFFYFFWSFETGHGIVVNESGNQKQIGDGSGTVSSGAFSFTNPEGAVITVTWIADENGFQATGDHFPTPHPMPEHVVKMLADMEAAALHAISTIP